MELNQEDIRKIIFKTIYSEEATKELLILKGGQALSIYRFSDRTSYDIDIGWVLFCYLVSCLKKCNFYYM